MNAVENESHEVPAHLKDKHLKVLKSLTGE